jgi:hypothetical protein
VVVGGERFLAADAELLHRRGVAVGVGEPEEGFAVAFLEDLDRAVQLAHRHDDDVESATPPAHDHTPLLRRGSPETLGR